MAIVFEEIAHGDEAYRAWLKAKCEQLIPDLESLMTSAYRAGEDDVGRDFINLLVDHREPKV